MIQKIVFTRNWSRLFDHFPRYHTKIILGDFNAKVGRENIFKLTIGNESLHEDSNDNGIRIVNLATSKNLVVKNMMFPQRNILKYRVIHKSLRDFRTRLRNNQDRHGRKEHINR